MACIIKKIKKGKPYYYAVQSGRVNGKPRIVWQKYLGTLEAIVQRTEQVTPPKPKETVIFEAGGVAVLLSIAQRLRVIDSINKFVPKRAQGPTVGHYIILAALNRALSPCSKKMIADWYSDTVLQRIWKFSKSSFTSQRFWDHMDMVDEEAIDSIQREIVKTIKQEFGFDGRILLYDTTNFFTFIATNNNRNSIAKRGHSKAKRHDLRQIGLALLVTQDFQIPLFHRVYPGNINDVGLFPKIAEELITKHDDIIGKHQESTLVFDRGNVNDEAMERLVVADKHFIAAVPVNRMSELLNVRMDKLEEIEGLAGTKAYKIPVQIWGKVCSGVIVYTESFFTKQLSGLTTNLVTCQNRLLDLKKRLLKWVEGKGRGKRPTMRSVEKNVQDILSAQFMKELFEVKIEKKNNMPFVYYQVNHKTFEKLINSRLGRTILITDRNNWDVKQIIEAYRSLTLIEDSFKNMKNIDFLHWQPAYHWTNQKLKVHGFYCVLALLLSSLAQKVAVKSGIDLTVIKLLKELSSIKEVAVIYPKGTLAHRKDHITLSRMSPKQKKLSELFEIHNILNR